MRWGNPYKPKETGAEPEPKPEIKRDPNTGLRLSEADLEHIENEVSTRGMAHVLKGLEEKPRPDHAFADD